MTRDYDVIVVGAGVAGLAAASALAQDGARVALLERRPNVGGRAYSYPHPALEEVVDSQHVLLGCCTNLIELCRQAGLADKIRWYDDQVFLLPEDPQGRPAPPPSPIVRQALPVPFQYASSLLGASMLSLADKLAMARGLSEFARGNTGRDDESAAQWYIRTRQTDRAIRHFWEPILLATLNDAAPNCSMRYAGKVFYEIFLKNSTGGRLGIPTVPLSEFYDSVAALAQTHGAQLHLRTSVEAMKHTAEGTWELEAGSQTFRASKVILALPFEQTQRLLANIDTGTSALEATRKELLALTDTFTHAPFISILLWFDRQITDLDHAWLLDTTIQWFFHKSRIRRYAPERGSYVELVIAGSRRELPLSRAQILEPAMAELARFFPAVRQAKLLKSGILKEARATFSVTPGLDRSRPEQATAIPGLYLAGDWTRTGWPSTMEGAARSGLLAAGAATGQPRRFLVPDLPAEGLMALLASADLQT